MPCTVTNNTSLFWGERKDCLHSISIAFLITGKKSSWFSLPFNDDIHFWSPRIMCQDYRSTCHALHNANAKMLIPHGVKTNGGFCKILLKFLKRNIQSKLNIALDLKLSC